MSVLFALLLSFCYLFPAFGVKVTQPVVVDLTSADLPTRIAVLTCSGFMNKKTDNNGVYTLINEPYDSDWLSDLYGISNPVLTSINDLMNECLSSYISGYIRYNYTLQHLIVPNLVTLSAVLNGVLLQDGSEYTKNSTLIFDSIVKFNNYSALDATKYMYYNYVNDTTTLAFMNPNPVNPGLIDYIIKKNIFNFFLNNACIRGTDEYEFVLFMTNPENNPWNNPINVMGYNNAWPVAGDLFEAETDCNALHNMGQIASDGFNNLAYFDKTPEINEPLIQNEAKYLKLNESKVYITFTIGDGDNLNYIKGSRREWILDRVNRCQQSNFSYLGCFPLQWSISPHLIYLAPLMLEWYYNESYITSNDYFVLPPSGHLYSYPSEMEYNTTQLNFIHSTEEDCKILSCNSTVAWEFVFHWYYALKNYFPRYGYEQNNQIIYALYGVNVPFNVPVAEFWYPELQFYKILNGNVIVFKPQEWRGTNHTTCTAGIPLSFEFCLSVDQMAEKINKYPGKTITQIYITSDGGGNLDMIYQLIPKLNENVEVVTGVQLIDLAFQAGEQL